MSAKSRPHVGFFGEFFRGSIESSSQGENRKSRQSPKPSSIFCFETALGRDAMRAATILFFTAVFLAPALSARDLGKPLPLKAHESGAPSFGASYTYGSDPDGINYMLMASPLLSPVIANQSLRWNFYLRSSDKFLLPWDSARKTTSLAVIGLRIGPKVPDHESVVNELLKAQGKPDELFFVLATNDNVPVYFLSISQLCATHPGNFKDLTFGRPCNEAFPQ